MTEDKKCLNCSRMTVSQDEYISGMQDKIHDLEKENAELKAELEKERQKSINIQKICFDSCL